MPEIITVGETMAAFTPGSSGLLRYVRNYEMRIAGAESNLAIGVSKLGHSAGWVSGLGKDEFGAFVQNSIRAEGVDTSRVRFDGEHRTGIMFKQIQDSSETSVFYYRENSAASHMDSSILDREYVRGCRILHLTGITPVLGNSCEQMVKYAMDLAASEGIMISFDPNIRRKLWKDRDYVPMLKEMVLKSQIVLLGLDEAETLFGSRDEKRIVDILFSGGRTEYAAIKNGGEGAVAADAEQICRIAPHPCNCIDPIGAGDAFNAAFLCGILEGKGIRECGVMGAVAGALATETYGDTEGYPTEEHMANVLCGKEKVYR